MPSERIQRQIDRLLDAAEQAFQQRDWEAARLHLQDVLDLDPANEDAQSFLAALERKAAPTPPAGPNLLSASPAHPELVEGGEGGTAAPAASDTRHPIPDTPPAAFVNGRYEVERFLGEGGKKRVYLAHDNLLDRDVAFALIKTEGLDQVGRDRIKREAQAMGRLGAHPHIVSVFDLGEEAGGQPYIVTELMKGGDVEGVIEKAPEHRLPLERTLEIGMEVCRGLEFAHSHGIVHRDLKPGNVWLTEDGTAKLGDFGLAVALDKTRLTQAGMMVGTVSYMPPEQAMGGEVTPRADLYSLGAMLYEMVTGRPPFLGDDTLAIIGQHLNTAPVAPSWHRPDCPRPLEALVLRLLAKDPNQRPTSAHDVQVALRAIDLARQPQSDEAQLEPEVLESLAGGVFVGRQREMGELKGALEEALSGQGRVVALVGEPGIGKTRTAQELATYAALRQIHVLWGRCYEGTGAPPYWPWVQMLRSHVRERPVEQLRADLGSGAADVAEVVSDVRERLPGVVRPPPLEPEQARFRLFDSITTFLRASSQAQPLMLVLEDLHWADRPTLLLLEFLARELAGARLLVVMTYRDVEVSRQHPLTLTLGELNRGLLLRRVVLRGLTPEDVERFIELTTGTAPPAGLAEAVYSQTEGNPLFVTEVVRLLVQEGLLASPPAPSQPSGAGGQSREHELWSVRIPEGVREVIGRRLNRLSERCNQALTLAAAIGRQFNLEQLAALSADLSRARLVDLVEEALAARIVEELVQPVGHYQFTHALIQETLVAELSLTRRVQVHAQIAEALEQLYGDQVAAHAGELAYHYAQAAALLGPAKLIQYSLLAGERALAGYAYEEALAHFQRGLDAMAGQLMDRQQADLLFGLARAQAATLEILQAREIVANLSRAFDYYAQSDALDRVVAVAECPVDALPGQPVGAARLVARALTLVEPDSHEAGRLFSRYARMVAIEEGNYPAAADACTRALAIARRDHDLPLEIQTLGNGAEADLNDLRLHEGLDKCLQAIELASRADVSQAALLPRLFACISLLNLGQLQRASEQTAALVIESERFRDRRWLISALWIDGTVAHFHGDWAVARDRLDQVVGLSPADPRPYWTRLKLEHAAGELARAKSLVDRLLEMVPLSPPRPEFGLATTVLVLSLIADDGLAEERLAEAEATAEAILSFPTVTKHVLLIARAALAVMAMHRRDVTAAARHYPELKVAAGMVLFEGLAGDRLLGLLAETISEDRAALRHFEDALAFCRSGGERVELAWTCLNYAELLLRCAAAIGPSAVEEQARATELLSEGLQIAHEIGMRPLSERILAHRPILKA